LLGVLVDDDREKQLAVFAAEVAPAARAALTATD
jgi:hypothetical protein